MNKETYETMMSAINARLEECNKYLKDINSTEDVENIPVKKIVELREFCKQEVEKMTRLCMVDLYHVIGMGNLTPVQQSQFLKTFKEYTDYRPIVKAISKHLTSFDDMPVIPVKTQFKTLELGIELTRGEGPETEDELESVETYSAIRDEICARKSAEQAAKAEEERAKKEELEAARNKNIFCLIGKDHDIIDMWQDKLELWYLEMKKAKILNGGDYSTLLTNVLKQASYLGIKWSIAYGLDGKCTYRGLPANKDVVAKMMQWAMTNQTEDTYTITDPLLSR